MHGPGMNAKPMARTCVFILHDMGVQKGGTVRELIE